MMRGGSVPRPPGGARALVLVRFDNVGKHFGGVDVLHGVTWQVDSGQSIGMVGENGAGKTTIIRLITGEYAPDEGEVTVHRSARISLLEQAPDVEPGISAVEEVMSARPDLRELEDTIEHLAGLIADPQADTRGRTVDRLLELHSRALEEYDHAGGHDFAARVARTLSGLGLPTDHHCLPLGKLSGGQRRRVALAKVLLDDVDLLLLDEPTNHLDIEAIEWLQGFLVGYSGAFIAISHDRYFLDAVCDRIAELEDLALTEYQGSYTSYRQQKEERAEADLKAWRLQQKEIRRQEEVIRWRRAQATPKAMRMAKVRERMLARMERLERPTLQRPRPTLRFAQPRSASNDVVEMKGLGKSFGERHLFADLGMMVTRGNRIGIVGPNGTGKTTLLRIVMGELEPTSGTIRRGRNIRVGYYCQEREDVDSSKTVLDSVATVRPDLIPEQLRKYLGRFLFTGDDVFLQTSVLSGGERSRVALAMLILGQPDLLLLDEPTNHLDIPSREVFEDALVDYQGTIIMASHDRYFLDRTVNRLLVMAGGTPALFPGNYSAWVSHRAGIEAAERDLLEREEAARKAAARARAPRPAMPRPKPAAADRGRPVEELERLIVAAEGRLAEVTDLLAEPDTYRDADTARGLTAEYDELRAEIGGLYEEYGE